MSTNWIPFQFYLNFLYSNSISILLFKFYIWISFQISYSNSIRFLLCQILFDFYIRISSIQILYHFHWISYIQTPFEFLYSISISIPLNFIYSNSLWISIFSFYFKLSLFILYYKSHFEIQHNLSFPKQIQNSISGSNSSLTTRKWILMMQLSSSESISQRLKWVQYYKTISKHFHLEIHFKNIIHTACKTI